MTFGVARRPKADWDGRDHSAPWHCSSFVCDRCSGKPPWVDWCKQIDARNRQRLAEKAERGDGR